MLAKMRMAIILMAGVAMSALTVGALQGTAQAQAGSTNLYASVSGSGGLLTGNGVILLLNGAMSAVPFHAAIVC